MRTSAGVCAAVPPPSLTRKPAMTRSGFACETTTSNAPGAGASTWPSSSCSAKRTDSDDWRRVRSPPKRASAVTHRVRSKKSRGNRTSPSAGPGGGGSRDAPSRVASPPRVSEGPPPRRSRRAASFAASAVRAAARSAARAVCFCWTSAAETPGGGGGSCANTCMDPSSRRTSKNAQSRSGGWNPATPIAAADWPLPDASALARVVVSHAPGPPPAPSDCAPTRPSPRETTAKPPSSLADAATNVGGGALVGPGAAPASAGAGAAHASSQCANPRGAAGEAPPEKRDVPSKRDDAPSRISSPSAITTHAAHAADALAFSKRVSKSARNATVPPPSNAAKATRCASE